jgi:hypothetical protein
MEKHVVFYASGSKGPEVRADGKGGHMTRGHYFIGRDGQTRGPYKSVRIAARARDADLNYTRPRLGTYREQMTDAGRGHLLRGDE